MTENRVQGYKRQEQERQKRAEEIIAAMPSCRIRITGVVGVMPPLRPRIGEILEARIIKPIYGSHKPVIVPAYWVPDSRYGKYGVIVYAEECEVLK